MPDLARIRIRSAPDGGWEFTFDAPGATTTGLIGVEVARDLRRRARAGGAELPLALGQALGAAPALLAALVMWLEGARAAGRSPVLVWEAQPFDARSLPWELLALPGQGALEREAGCVIARLRVEGGSESTPEAGELSALLWLEHPQSAESVELEATLSGVMAELGLPAPVRLRTGEISWVERDAARVLHLHGRAAALSSALRGTTLDGEGEFELLPPALGRSALAVVHPVADPHGGEADLDHLVSDLLQAGVPAVLVAQAPLSGVAASALCRGLYAALAAEGSLPAAAAAARQSLGPEEPLLQLVVSNLETLRQGALLRERWRPEGWPRPSSEAAALLQSAFEIASLTRSGFVGLEHLALTLARAGQGASADRTRQLLILRRDQLREHLAAYAPVPGRGADWRGTQRLRAYGGQLQAGFSPAALWRVVVEDAGPILRELARGPTPTPSTQPVLAGGDPSAPPARALQVIGGPEDGRILHLDAGQTLGRWSEGPGADHALYADTTLVDRYLSRQHLRWLGDGSVELLAPGRLLVREGAREVLAKGLVRLVPDDLLILTRGTWLRAL